MLMEEKTAMPTATVVMFKHLYTSMFIGRKTVLEGRESASKEALVSMAASIVAARAETPDNYRKT